MKITKTECPRCNSTQSFRPQIRDTDQGWQEIYIRCTKCRWEKVVDVTTGLIEAAKKKEQKLKRRAAWEVARHGICSSSTRKSWDRAVEHLLDLRSALNKEMERGSATNS